MNDELIKDILQWDVKAWTKPLKYWEENVDWNKVGTVLELGGNQGGLSLWMASKGLSVVCSDLKNVELSAEKLHKKYPFSTLINYQDIDATSIPYQDYFDIIIFKSIIGGIGRNNNFEIQKQVFREIHKALKPGGKLLFAENLIASPLHQLLRKKFVKWGDSWRYITLEETNILLKDFSSKTVKSTGVLSALGRTENQRQALAGIDSLLFNRILPEKWKYIVYGMAVK